MLKLRDILKFIGRSMKVDYIIRQGEMGGIWKYRDWNSGYTEIEGIWTGNLTSYAPAYNGWYPYVATLGLPSRTYNPNVTYIFQCSNTYCFPMGIGAHAPAYLDSVNLYGMALQGGTQKCTFYVHITGRWK